MWNFDDILGTLSSALQAEHDRLTSEQAVHNLDALDEVALHPLLGAALAGSGLGVLREHPYPSEWLSKPGRRKKLLPDESQRLRCDLVLTPAPGQALIDPLAARRDVVADLAAAEGTLYSSIATQRALRPGVVGGIPPDEACWLELKVVGQFCHTAGVPGPNRAYTSQLIRGTINDLKKQRNAVILAHNYMTPEIFHCVGDIRGDSLALAKEAAKTEAKVIVQAGVHFMAETSKILCPDKTVLIPDPKAGCSLAESITAEDVRMLRAAYPGVPIVTYVNTSADVKAESDICCTSSNAAAVVEWAAREWKTDRVILLPDEYLAKNVATQTGIHIIVDGDAPGHGIGNQEFDPCLIEMIRRG